MKRIYCNSNMIERLLTTEPTCADECFGEDETFSVTASFGDGYEMDIKICGVQFTDGESNLPWTEAVLFHNGSEVCCSDPCDEFYGIWELEEDGRVFETEIVRG